MTARLALVVATVMISATTALAQRADSLRIGARVRVTTSKMTQIDEVHAGGSYNSTNDTRLHFGLGAETTITKIELFWPSGLRQEFRGIQGDAIYEIKEGEPIRKTTTLPAL